MLMKLILKLFGKNIVEGYLVKAKVSKTKVVAIVAGVLFIVEKTLPAFGVNFQIPNEVYELLAATGLWTLSDKMDSQPSTPVKPGDIIEPPVTTPVDPAA